MKTLYFMTNEELVRFANERGVKVVTSEEDIIDEEEDLMCRHELAELPTQVPRFDGLAPEIRNLIYEELLCFKEGEFSCFPEILCTNKQIHKEARGILYGKNEIDVQLSNDGIIVQGESSNTYLESRFGSRPAHTRNASQRLLGDIEWPEFLRQVQNLRFSIIDSHKSQFHDVRKVSNENVLYSLCTFLWNDSKLETFKVDLRRRDRQNKVVARTSDLHCLLLLGPVPVLKIEGNGMFDRLAVDSEVDLCPIARSSMARCREFNDECQLFEQTSMHPVTPRDRDLLYAFTDLVSEAFDKRIEPIIDKLKLTKDEAAENFCYFMEDIRDAMDRYDIPLRKSLPLITALDKLLHFDIDTTAARHTHRRIQREMAADE